MKCRIGSAAGWMLALGWFAATALGGCAPIQEEDYVKTCVLNEDQTGTFDGKWRIPPVPIAVEAGRFSEGEKSTIRMAIQQWNTFAQAVYHLPLLDAGASGMPEITTERPSQVCASAQPLIVGSQFVNRIVIYKHGTWPYSTTGAIAITSTCPTGSSTPRTFYNGMIDLNYQHFFVAGKRIPDLQSILVHELGHLMGLRHSCESSTTGAGVPTCSAAGLREEYKDAVMFPVFGFDTSGMGEKRFKPNPNDQGRMNCLYLPQQ